MDEPTYEVVEHSRTTTFWTIDDGALRYTLSDGSVTLSEVGGNYVEDRLTFRVWDWPQIRAALNAIYDQAVKEDSK